jgi:cytochrome c oxidase subunit 4
LTARALLVAWLALMVLAVGSFMLSFAHLGRLGLPAALLIAMVKAVIVVTVFMELAVEKPAVRLTLIASVAFLALLVAFVLADLATR